MRSITFGPTSYLEDSRQYSRHSDDEDDGQNTHISNESVGNSYSSSIRGVNEVIFYASENLFREGFTTGGSAGSHHRELAMKKYCKCKFAFDPQRTFQSYCFEFCGLLNIRMYDCKFYLGSREMPLSRQVRKPCIIEVQGSHGSTNSPKNGQVGNNCLQSAISLLLKKGLYSDIEIMINKDEEQIIRAHKCILMARSEKYKAMLESQMLESRQSRVEINDPDITSSTYRLLIQWIYEGECDLNGCSIEEMLSLLKLTDEYLLADLQKVCEDSIIDFMDGFAALHILTESKILIPENSESTIKDTSKSVLLDEYEIVEKQIPDIEEKISKVKGLMSDLFTHKLKKKKSGATSRSRRKGSLIIDDGQSKKKVRFNISSTIYEEASAIIHDESDSMIEPLSIYSNNSPPGELNEDIMAGAMSNRSLSMPTVSERRSSEAGMQLNSSLNVVSSGNENELIRARDIHQASTNELDPSEIVGMRDNISQASPRVRFNLRPASAGRNQQNILEGQSSSLRRASSYRLEIEQIDEGGNRSAGVPDGGISHSSVPGTGMTPTRIQRHGLSSSQSLI